MNAPTKIDPEALGIIDAPEISVVRMGTSDASINAYMRFHSSDFMRKLVPDGKETAASLHRGVQAMLDGRVIAYAAMVGEEVAGVLYGTLVSDALGTAHWGMYPEYRHLSSRMGKLTVDKVIEDLNLRCIMGLIPVRNRASYAGAYRIGFRAQGKIPRYYLKNGELQDVHIMIYNKEGV